MTFYTDYLRPGCQPEVHYVRLYLHLYHPHSDWYVRFDTFVTNPL